MCAHIAFSQAQYMHTNTHTHFSSSIYLHHAPHSKFMNEITSFTLALMAESHDLKQENNKNNAKPKSNNNNGGSNKCHDASKQEMSREMAIKAAMHFLF